jgi:hypothetical protein
VLSEQNLKGDHIMKKKIKRLIILTMAAAVPTIVIWNQAIAAVPSLTNQCQGKIPALAHPENSTGVLFDEDCSTVFILPPETGRASLAALARNAGNLQFCPAVLQAGDTALALANSAKITAERINRMVADYEPVKEELSRISAEAAIAESDVKEISSKLELAEEHKSEALADVSRVQGELDSCEILTPGRCGSQAQELQQVKQAYVTAKREVDALKGEKITATGKLDRLKAKKKEVDEEYSAALDKMTDLLIRLGEINQRIENLYATWSPMEGATAQLVYSIEWAKLVTAYRTANQPAVDRGLQFQPVTIVDGQFFATSKVPTTNDVTNRPAVLSSIVPGAQPYGLNHLDGGDVVIHPSDTDESNAASKPPLNQSMLGGGLHSVSGQVILSLNGVCQFFPQGMDSPDRDQIDASELAAHLIVNAQLAYDVKVRRKYKATFNLKNLVESIEKKSEAKKWFFQSEDVHELVTSNDHKSWFDISFDVDAADFSFTSEEQQQITKEVKADLVARALKNISAVTSKAPALPDLGKTGYEQQDKLKCPNWYCQGFNYALGAANGFFGKKEAVSKFKESNSAWVSDQVAQAKVIERRLVLTFVP